MTVVLNSKEDYFNFQDEMFKIFPEGNNMTKSLKDFSYYKTGGSCYKLHLPTNIADMQKAMQEIISSNKDFFVLGGGVTHFSFRRLLRWSCYSYKLNE